VIVIGLAVGERESWVISGFEPQDEMEDALIQEERDRLGYNPCERSHELTAGCEDQAHLTAQSVFFGTYRE